MTDPSRPLTPPTPSIQVAEVPTPVLEALAAQIAAELARRGVPPSPPKRPVHRARGIHGEATHCPQCKAKPTEPCLFEEEARPPTPTEQALLSSDPPAVSTPPTTPEPAPEQRMEIDPRADGKKNVLDAGDAVFLRLDSTHRMGRVVSIEVGPSYRSGELRYRIAWPDFYSSGSWAHTYHTRDQLYYCGFIYPGMEATPDGPTMPGVVDPSRRPAVYHGHVPGHVTAPPREPFR